MTSIRRPIAMLALAGLALMLVGAAPAARDGHGAAETRLQLLSLGVSGLPVDDLDASLGSLVTRAGTVGDPADARILLETLRAGGTTVADWEATSAEGGSRGDHAIPIDGPGVTGGVSIVDYLAEADGDALARVAALTGDLDAGPLGLAADLGQRGVRSHVTSTAATGITEVGIDGLRLDVGDLLPTDLLDALPLGLAIDLLDELPVDLDGDLADALASLEDLFAGLEEIVDLDDQRRDVFAALRDLLGDHPDVVDAEAVVAGAETALADAEADLAALQSDIEAALATLAGAEQALAEAQADLADAEQVVTGLEAERTALQSELATLESDLASLRSLGLTDLVSGLLTLQSTYDDAGCDPVTGLLSTQALQAIANCYDDHLVGLIAEVEAELDHLATELADAIDVRDTLQAAVTDAETLVDAAEDELAELTDDVALAESTLDEAARLLDEAEAELERIITEVADSADTLALLDDLEELTDRVRDLLDGLPDLLGALPDLEELRGGLVGAIGEATLFDLGRLAIEVEVRADAAGADSDVSCTVSDVAVIGQAPLPELDCAALGTALDHVEGVLGGLLGALPVDLPVAVELGGLQVSTSTDEDADAGSSEAAASVSALRAAIGSVELTALVDDLTGRLDSLIDDTLGVLDGVGDLDMDDLPLLGDARVAGVSTASLTGDLGALGDVVDGLPVGDALAGLRTVGLDLAVAGIDADGAFLAAEEGTEPGDPTDPDPTPDPDPDPEPDPTPDPEPDPTPDPEPDPTPGVDPAPAPDPVSGPGETPDPDPTPAEAPRSPDDDAGPEVPTSTPESGGPSPDGSGPGADGGTPELPRTGTGGLLPLLGACLVLAGGWLRRP